VNGPADKWAYTPIELGAIWRMLINLEDCSFDRYRRARFFATLRDQRSADIVLRAAVAEYDVPTVEKMIDAEDIVMTRDTCSLCRYMGPKGPCSRHRA
jgi:hypothetical protein